MRSNRPQSPDSSHATEPSYRKNAIAAGIFFIACSAFTILSVVPINGLLDAPGYLTALAANDGHVVLSALIQFVWAFTAAGIAISLYPALRRHSRALAIGSVAARAVEGAFVVVGALSLLMLLTLSQHYVVAGAPTASSWLTTGDMLLAARSWIGGFLMSLMFGLGALMYYYVLYRSRLVPRWLSGWGVVAAGLAVVAALYAGFTQELGFSTVNNVLSAPIALQEMVLAVWLIAKGFRTSPVASARPAQVEAMTA